MSTKTKTSPEINTKSVLITLETNSIYNDRNMYYQLGLLALPMITLFFITLISSLFLLISGENISNLNTDTISFYVLDSVMVLPIFGLAAWQINTLWKDIQNPQDYLRPAKTGSLGLTTIVLTLNLLTFAIPGQNYTLALYGLTITNFLMSYAHRMATENLHLGKSKIAKKKVSKSRSKKTVLIA